MVQLGRKGSSGTRDAWDSAAEEEEEEVEKEEEAKSQKDEEHVIPLIRCI